MSAWTVSKGHIDALVYWLEKSEISKADKDTLGGRLWTENYRSVNYRYGQRNRRPVYRYSRPLPIASRPPYDDFDPENIDQILNLAHCYDYQSCETSDYYETPSARNILKLIKYLERVGADADREGTRNPWGI